MRAARRLPAGVPLPVSITSFTNINAVLSLGLAPVLWAVCLASPGGIFAAPLPPDIVWKSGLHSNFVNSVAISPDGTLLASASGDTTIKLWRLSDGTPLRTLIG